MKLTGQEVQKQSRLLIAGFLAAMTALFFFG